MRQILFATLVLLFAALLTVHPAQAQLRVDVTQGQMQPLPIAIAPFHAKTPEHKALAADVPAVIRDNLERSGLFRPVSEEAFAQDASSLAIEGARYSEWRATGAQSLVYGEVSTQENGHTRVEFRLLDVLGQKQIIGMAYTTTQDNWRRVAHIISDQIYSRLTGENPYFDSRIVYISESGPPVKRIKRLAIMDQDGANHKYLTDGKYLVLTPRFSPSEQIIAYMSYEGKGPRVYLYDLATGKREVLGDFPGMTFAPRFSPDGKRVIMSQAVNGNSDIYEINLATRKKHRITSNSAIDTAPSYSPDGQQIVFESDRGGSQQLYIMDVKGGEAKRITFGKGRYGNPVWSPRGDLIAFTRIYQKKFYIGVIRPDGSGERLITNAYHVEGPSWSPNGRVLTYFKERPMGTQGNLRKARLFTIDITGYNERIVETPQDASDPAWSPLN